MRSSRTTAGWKSSRRSFSTASAIVSAELFEAEERLGGTPVMASARAGMLRTSWHVYNTEDDVERVLGLLSGAGQPLGPGSGAA